MARKRLLVCSGKHCRKAFQRDDHLRDALQRLPVDVKWVRCQKVCRGPVVGLAVDGDWQWFERMDTRKAVHALAEFVAGGELGRRLDKRRSRKRTGKLRA